MNSLLNRRNFLLLSFLSPVILSLLLSCDKSALQPRIDLSIDEAVSFSLNKLAATVEEIPSDKYPIRTQGLGRWECTDASAWTSGFFPGCLWFAYEITGQTKWKKHAQEFTKGLEEQKFNTGTHDLGFMLFNSCGNGYRLTKDESYKNTILTAAQSLASRYNANVGCIQSWNGDFQVIIDNMMNLELLFWASKNGGAPQFYDMAVSHALKTIENHIRKDGSCYHVVIYDPGNGNVIKKRTAQGFDVNSTWARGQAWGIYGFTMTFRETQDQRFLETARKMANFFINHLPNDYIPFWDLELPSDSDKPYKDVSAAAIAVSALLELNLIDPQPNNYLTTAESILSSLTQSYLSTGTNSSGILLHGAYNVNSNNPFDWDSSVIWADYYFLEALLRYGTNR